MSSLLPTLFIALLLVLSVTHFSEASALWGWGAPWNGFGYGIGGYGFGPFGGPWGRRWGGWGWGW